MKRLLLCLTLATTPGPAAAYHEGTLAARVAYCSTLAYAYVEAIVTYRQGIEVALESVRPTPLGADGTEIVYAVHFVTSTGVVRAEDYLQECLDTVQGLARPDAQAMTAAEGLQVELNFAVEELDELEDELRTQEANLRARLGERLAPTAPTLLFDYRTFALRLQGKVTAFRAQGVTIGDRVKR